MPPRFSSTPRFRYSPALGATLSRTLLIVKW